MSFGGFGQQPQQNPFGQPAQPSAFGTGTSAFGQQQPQTPQPSGFGAFGASSATPAFGATAPAFGAQPTGFGGGTGGTGAFGGTTGGTGFGAGATPSFGGGLRPGGFGQTQPAATSAFGGTGGAFGGQQTGAFGGAPASGFGQGLAFGGGNQPVPNNGTAAVPYSATRLTRTANNTDEISLESITGMDAYKGSSLEELRLADYEGGRKTGQPGAMPGQQVGGFGQQTQQPSLFGAGGTSTGSTTNLFGQPQQQPPAGGAFGQQTSTGFGAPSQPANTFGAKPNPFGATTSAFGQTSAFSQAPQQPATSAFGQTQPSSGFGLGGTGTSAFGQSNQPKPAFGAFGAQPAQSGFGTTGAFGQQNQNPFGQNQQQQQQPQQQTGGIFGQQEQQQPATSAFGGFGQQPQQQQQQPQQQPSLFGTNPFGQQQSQQQPAQPTNSWLKPATTTQPTGTGFGGTTGGAFSLGNQNQTTSAFGQQPKPNPFGTFGTGGTSNLFGQPQQQQNQPGQATNAPGTSAFGQSTGMFGNLGGNQNQQAGTNSFGLGSSTGQGLGATLFGNSTNQQPGGLGGFGSLTAPKPNFGGSLFGQPQQQQQPNLQASLDQNPYGNNPIFASTAPLGPSTIGIGSVEKKKPPILTSVRASPRPVTKVSRLRGFSTSVSPAPSSPGAFGRSATPDSVSRLSLRNTLDSDGFFTDLPKVSPKKLVLDRKSTQDDFLNRRAASQSPEVQTNGRSVTFDPALELGFSTRRPSRSGSEPVNLTQHIGPIGGRERSETPALDVETHNEPDTGVAGNEYYSKPPLKVLLSLPPSELSSIPDFVVGRKGFGEVRFAQPVDLTTLPSVRDLYGKIVTFGDKSCTVYSDDMEDIKPEPGNGLNVPAVVVLERCWPTDKATRGPIKDPAHPRMKQHVTKLKKIPETKFIDFVAEEGRWTFRVEHFSRYGLDGDESEGDDIPEETRTGRDGQEDGVRKKATSRTRLAGTHPSRSPTASDITLDTEDDAPPVLTLDEMDDEMTPAPESSARRSTTPNVPQRRIPPRRRPNRADDSGVESDETDTGDQTPHKAAKRFDPASPHSSHSPPPPSESAHRPFAQTLGLEPRKLNVMQASFFRQPAPAPAPVPGSQSNKLFDIHAKATKPPTAPRESSLQHQETRRKLNEVPRAVAQPEIRHNPTFRAQPSVMSGKEGLLTDASLAMGRSFRVGWGPQGQLVNPSIEGRGGLRSYNVKIQNMTVFSEPEDVEVERAQKLLHKHLEHTIIDSEDDRPSATTHQNLRFRHMAQIFPEKEVSHERSVWRLGEALFDEIPLDVPTNVPDSTKTAVSVLRRQEAFSHWLEEVVLGAVEVDLRTQGSLGDPTSTTFTLLTGHQIERACNAAVGAGDLRLSTLLSQAGGDDDFRNDLAMQLSRWREYRVDPHITDSIRKVYELLSANVGVAPGRRMDPADTSKTIFLPEGLDWKRVLGLHVWYAHWQAPLRRSLDTYIEAIQSDTRTARPLPWYKERPSELAGKLQWIVPDDSIRDILFELTALHEDQFHELETVLLPRTFSPSPLDYRLSWHLYSILSKVLHWRDFQDRPETIDRNSDQLVRALSFRGDYVTCSYASQLERLGLWQWSAFILLHLQLPESRTKAIQELLARNAQSIEDESESFLFLTETLKIAPTWIFAARALAAKYQRDLLSESDLLLRAELWTQSHAVIANELAPDVVLANDMSALRTLFANIVPYHTKVGNWQNGGKVYLEYADMVEGKPIEDGRDLLEPGSSAYTRRASDLVARIPNLFGSGTKTLKKRACIAEMLSQLVRLSSRASIIKKPLTSLRPRHLPEPSRIQWLSNLAQSHLATSVASAAVA